MKGVSSPDAPELESKESPTRALTRLKESLLNGPHIINIIEGLYSRAVVNVLVNRTAKLN